MSKPFVLVKHNDTGISEIRLNRIKKHNAFNRSMVEELITALAECANNPTCRLLNITSAGEYFSAGADIDWMRTSGENTQDENHEDATKLATLLDKLYNFPHPTVALVQGPAFGGAIGLICCCDIALATTNSYFAFSETKLGIIPAVISPYVVQSIGARSAKRLFLTTEQFSAEEALSLGIITQLCADTESLKKSCSATNEKLLRNGPYALSQVKLLIKQVSSTSINNDLIGYTVNTITEIRSGKEAREGLSAFLEKRPVNWLNG